MSFRSHWKPTSSLPMSKVTKTCLLVKKKACKFFALHWKEKKREKATNHSWLVYKLFCHQFLITAPYRTSWKTPRRQKTAFLITDTISCKKVLLMLSLPPCRVVQNCESNLFFSLLSWTFLTLRFCAKIDMLVAPSYNRVADYASWVWLKSLDHLLKTSRAKGLCW